MTLLRSSPLVRRVFGYCGLGFGLTLCLLACRLPTWNQLNYTRQEPGKVDLVGIWVPDEATLQLMHQNGRYDTRVQPRLTLRADGSFELVNMPDWWTNNFGESHGEFESYSGNWLISKSGQVWNVELRPPSGTRFAGLIGQSPPYRIDFTIGDADENESMIFEKQNSSLR
jgi:hypothetical protein